MDHVADTTNVYESCVGYLVSENSKADSWKKLATFIADQVQKGTPPDVLEQMLESIEQQVKADFSLPKLPNAWRSAKSVALRAAQGGVPLLDGEKVVGKSAVEKGLRSAAPVPVPMSDLMGVYVKLIEAERALMSTSESDPTELAMVGMALSRVTVAANAKGVAYSA